MGYKIYTNWVYNNLNIYPFNIKIKDIPIEYKKYLNIYPLSISNI